MSAITLIRVFSKIVRSSFDLRGQSDLRREQIKQDWGQSILKTLGFEMSVNGKTPTSESQILVGNHISYLDIPVILAAFPRAVFVAKDDLLGWPIIGAGAKAADTIFIRRAKGSDRSNSREQILKMLHQKKTSVVVFPAGTSTLQETVAWKKGIFEIAKSAQVPVQLFRLDLPSHTSSPSFCTANFFV